MDITYLRSSSFGSWEFCQHKYYLNFNLGLDDPANRSAEKGTIVHKVMEILAKIKLAFQETEEKAVTITDDIVGELTVNKSDLYKETILNKVEIEFINSTRQNLSNYKPEHQLKLGHTRYGVNLVDSLILPCFNFYKSKSVHKWYPQDFKDCQNWVWMGLDYNAGQMDPRRQSIVQPERRFDIIIDKPWATYSIDTPNGKLEGYLSFKGTIDLIIKTEYGYEVVDYKTGQRKNWAKGYVKNYEHFQKDPQLILYYYAVKKLYPEIDNVIMNIFYIRDGGTYSLCYDDEYIKMAEKLLAFQFNQIKKSTVPKLCSPKQTDFKCTKLCHFYKNSFPDSDMNICKEIEKSIKEIGLDETTKKYQKLGHSVGTYKAPGE